MLCYVHSVTPSVRKNLTRCQIHRSLLSHAELCAVTISECIFHTLLYTVTIPLGEHLSCCVMCSHYNRKCASHAVLCSDTVSGGLCLMLCLVHSHHTRKNVLLCSTVSTVEVRISHYQDFKFSYATYPGTFLESKSSSPF